MFRLKLHSVCRELSKRVLPPNSICNSRNSVIRSAVPSVSDSLCPTNSIGIELHVTNVVIEVIMQRPRSYVGDDDFYEGGREGLKGGL